MSPDARIYPRFRRLQIKRSFELARAALESTRVTQRSDNLNSNSTDCCLVRKYFGMSFQARDSPRLAYFRLAIPPAANADFAGLARPEEYLNTRCLHRIIGGTTPRAIVPLINRRSRRSMSAHFRTRARGGIENSPAALKYRAFGLLQDRRAIPARSSDVSLLHTRWNVIRIGVASIRRSAARGEFSARRSAREPKRTEMRRADPWEDFARRTQ